MKFLLKLLSIFLIPSLVLANGSSTGGVVMNAEQLSFGAEFGAAYDFTGNQSLKNEMIGEVTLSEVYNNLNGVTIKVIGDGTTAVYVNPNETDLENALNSLTVTPGQYLSYEGIQALDDKPMAFRVDSGLAASMPESSLREALIKHGVGATVVDATYGFDPSSEITNEMILNYPEVSIESYVGDGSKIDF